MSGAQASSSGPEERPDDRGKSVRKDPDRLTPLREMQLVEAYRGGDSEAMARLLVSYQRRVFSICYRMVRHVETAADLTQDVLVKMIESIDKYDGRSKLSTWVFRIATNTCLSWLRGQKLRRHLSLEEQLAYAGGSEGADGGGGLRISNLPASEEPDAAEHVERDEDLKQVSEALNRINAEQRALLVLRDIHGLEYQELAEVLEVPVGTIKSRLFRARSALRDAVEQGADTTEQDDE